MKKIFLSPHLDDAVYSCGGLIREVVENGDAVSIWTVFSGDPPSESLSPFARSLHERWGSIANPSQARRLEDVKACEILGCTYLHLNYLDCIYRTFADGVTFRIKEEQDLFTPIQITDEPLLIEITSELDEILPRDCELVVPLSVGGHIDHHIVRAAAECLSFPLSYYAEFPYAAMPEAAISSLIPGSALEKFQGISKSALKYWQDAVGAYQSQISTFWGSENEMREKVRDFSLSQMASRLWKSAN